MESHWTARRIDLPLPVKIPRRQRTDDDRAVRASSGKQRAVAAEIEGAESVRRKARFREHESGSGNVDRPDFQRISGVGTDCQVTAVGAHLQGRVGYGFGNSTD